MAANAALRPVTDRGGMSYTTRTTIALTLVLISFGPLAIGSASDSTVVAGQSVPQGQTIDFHVPSQAAGAAPLIVLLHGGGDKGNGDMTPLARTLAGRGAVVAVPNYYSGQPRSQQEIEDTFRDVVCSIRYSRSRAAEFGADPENLILVGFSYGGYPATAIRLTAEGSYDFDCLPGISHLPQAVVGLGGAYKYDSKVATRSWDKDHTPYLIDGVSRSSQIPLVMVHGARDANVPAEFAERYFSQLDEAGHPVGLEILETRHAELIDPDDPAGAQALESILDVALGEPAVGRSGPATTSPYARLMQSSRSS